MRNIERLDDALNTQAKYVIMADGPVIATAPVEQGMPPKQRHIKLDVTLTLKWGGFHGVCVYRASFTRTLLTLTDVARRKPI